MSTIQCNNCGRRIIQNGDECPHCEEPIPRIKSLKKPLANIFKLEEKETPKIETQKEDFLIKCKVCGQMISKNTQSCPHCGEPMQEPVKFYAPSPTKEKTSWWTWFFLLLFIGYIFGEVDKKKTKSTSLSSSYTKTTKYTEKRRTTLKGRYFACTTNALFDEITLAAVNKDNLAIGHLLSIGCLLTKPGVRMSIIDFGFGTTKIRAYTENDSIILYTNTENVYY